MTFVSLFLNPNVQTGQIGEIAMEPQIVLDSQEYHDQDEDIHENLTLEDLLFICGHAELGLSIRDALEINPRYRRELERPF